jgi:GNAT superfamily N-acetyltransferase
MSETISLDLVEHDLINNARFIALSLTYDSELRELARGRGGMSVYTPKLIELEIITSPGAWYMIKVNDINIGWCRLTPVDRWEASLGIVIADPAYRGKGIGYQIGKIMLSLAFPVFHKVTWYTWDYNDASIMLAKKLGFTLAETYSYCHMKDGKTVQDYSGLKFMKGRLDDYEKRKKELQEERGEGDTNQLQEVETQKKS